MLTRPGAAVKPRLRRSADRHRSTPIDLVPRRTASGLRDRRRGHRGHL